MNWTDVFLFATIYVAFFHVGFIVGKYVEKRNNEARNKESD